MPDEINIEHPIVTVAGSTYVVKVGSSFRPARATSVPQWYVVAFTRDLDGYDIPLAGPFGSRFEAGEALKNDLPVDTLDEEAREIIGALREAYGERLGY